MRGPRDFACEIWPFVAPSALSASSRPPIRPSTARRPQAAPAPNQTPAQRYEPIPAAEPPNHSCDEPRRLQRPAKRKVMGTVAARRIVKVRLVRIQLAEPRDGGARSTDAADARRHGSRAELHPSARHTASVPTRAGTSWRRVICSTGFASGTACRATRTSSSRRTATTEPARDLRTRSD